MVAGRNTLLAYEQLAHSANVYWLQQLWWHLDECSSVAVWPGARRSRGDLGVGAVVPQL